MKNEKPSRRQTRLLLTAMADSDGRLERAALARSRFKRDITAEIQRLRQAEAAAKLRPLAISQLNTYLPGIRTSLLKNAGYRTFADLALLDESQLRAINGIGEDQASRIVGLIGPMLKDLAEEITIRIDGDHPEKSKALLELMYLYQHARELSEQAKPLYERTHTEITTRLADLRKADCGFLRWLFTSRRVKNLACDAFAYLDELDTGSYKETVDSLDGQYTSLLKTAETEAVNDFLAHAASYYALLDQFDEAAGKVEIPSIPQDLQDDIAAVNFDDTDIKAQLRRYQTFAVKYILHQKRVLLGDEMGLGKTVEALAAMAALNRMDRKHFLVICPLSVLLNWEKETRVHTALTPFVMHGWHREIFAAWQESGGILLCNYDTVHKLPSPLEDEDIVIDMVTADEAHLLKNRSTRRTRAVLPWLAAAEYALFMTGTPLENSVDEMVSIISCLNPAIAEELKDKAYLFYAGSFRSAAAPLYLRRKREDVLAELPEKIESDEWLFMSEDDRELYTYALEAGNFMEIRRVSWLAESPFSSAKAERMQEIIEHAKEENRRVIVFSFFLETLRQIRMLEGITFYGPIQGSVAMEERSRILENFENSAPGSVLLCQITSGGTGLNIQCASVVIFAEPQMKPSLETQAISRVYRMGQVRTVLVYRLLCAETVDEAIIDMLERKQQAFDVFADSSEAAEIHEKEWIAETIEAQRKKYGTDSPTGGKHE